MQIGTWVFKFLATSVVTVVQVFYHNPHAYYVLVTGTLCSKTCMHDKTVIQRSIMGYYKNDFILVYLDAYIGILV